MHRKAVFLVVLAAAWYAAPRAQAQPSGFNYEESKVPDYTLPDPLTTIDGKRVTDADTWWQVRRPEILELFKREVYGRSPGKPEAMKFRVTSVDKSALQGKAVRKLVTVLFDGRDDGPQMDLLMYLPADAGQPVPLFVGLNFRGNHATTDDPAVPISDRWMRPGPGVVDHRATEATRGVAADRWPMEMIVSKGFGVATIYCGDIDPDFHDGFNNGVHALYPTSGERPADAWGTIGAWAWGLSRALDYFETDDDVDHQHVAVIGHSRLGKTALWAGASDPRFALVVSNNSGCGGAALSRRRFGETVKRINTSFPHWFCDNFKKYNDNEDACPVDQHELIALIAPRPVYVASATGDSWADPRGEFLAAKHAEPVYRLLGAGGLPADKQPPPDTPVADGLAYHLRTGKHDITKYDWQQYLDFARKHFRP